MRTNNKLISIVAACALCTSVNVMAQEIMEPESLNQITEILASDARLKSRVSAEEIVKSQDSALKMNSLIKEAIKVNGLANDGFISIADTREINKYLVQNHSNEWYELRTQYSVDNRRDSETIAMNTKAAPLWGKIYNLGFEAKDKKRLSNAIGNKSAKITEIGYYLGEIVKNDIASGELNNPDFEEVIGTTGTNLDKIVNVILNDKGLVKKIPTSDLRAGARSADAMNNLIMEAIVNEGLANDGVLSTADIRQINSYLVGNHKEKWAELHGDDEDGAETGYHLVQNDGAYSRMFADNVMNSVADGIYHLGFETNRKNRLLNEDGDANKRFEKVAWWLDTSLKSDLTTGKFNNPEYEEIVGTTSTSFDKIISYIYNDEGLLLNVSMADIREASKSANSMNELIVEAIKNTGAATDNHITAEEVKLLNEYLVSRYETEWAELHGDDENGEETGYHRVQNDGALGTAYSKNVINKLADGIYHLGFRTAYSNRLVNEDGNKNVTFTNVAYWLNKSLKEDYTNGSF